MLFHFTCTHGKKDIGTGSRALLIPHLHPLLGIKVLWLTDLAEPMPYDVGLTQSYIKCDRREFRYVVEEDAQRCRRWRTSIERASSPSRVVHDLESYGQPDTWWISDVALLARYDRTYQKRAA